MFSQCMLYPKIIFPILPIIIKITNNNIYMPNIYIHYRSYISNMLHRSTPGWLAYGQYKSCTKRCLEFEKNVVSHMTFVGWLTMLYGDIVHASFVLKL